MPLTRKSIPALLASADGWKGDSGSAQTRPIWTARETEPNGGVGHMCMSLVRLPRGTALKARRHPSHATLMLCWDDGTPAPKDNPPAVSVVFTDRSAGDACFKTSLLRSQTLVLPDDSPYSVANIADRPMAVLVVHALHGVPLQSVPLPADWAPQPVEIPQERVSDYRRDLMDKRWFEFNNDPTLRCVRKRVWGRDGWYEKDRDYRRAGDSDNLKAQFHLTNYCFEYGQTNPGHFHPMSVELVINLAGSPSMKVRERTDDGWEPNAAREELEPGDTVLVKMAAWHEYLNDRRAYKSAPDSANNRNRSHVLAMQAPHPIMHTLERETDLYVAPEPQGGT